MPNKQTVIPRIPSPRELVAEMDVGEEMRRAAAARKIEEDRRNAKFLSDKCFDSVVGTFADRAVEAARNGHRSLSLLMLSSSTDPRKEAFFRLKEFFEDSGYTVHVKNSSDKNTVQGLSFFSNEKDDLVGLELSVSW